VESLAEGAHFDEDTQGFRRIVAHGDEWMHSQLIHEGVEQRVRVEVRGLGGGRESPLNLFIDKIMLLSNLKMDLMASSTPAWSLGREVLTRDKPRLADAKLLPVGLHT